MSRPAADRPLKKKILILLARDPVTEVRVFHLSAKTLAEAGHKVSILAPRYHGNEETGTLDGVHFHTYEKIANPLLRKFHTLFTLARAALRSDADVFQVFEVDAPLLAAAFAKWVHRLRGRRVKLVFDNSEIWPYFYASRNRFRTLRPLIIRCVAAYEWIMVRCSVDGILAAHELEAQYYRKIDSKLPVRLAVAGVDFTLPPPKRSTRPGKTRYIGYDGFVTQRNGLDTMLAAFDLIAADYPEAVLVLGGDLQQPGDREVFERWKRSSRFADRVEWPGWVDREQQLANLNRFEIGLAPYHEDEHTNRIWPPNKLMNYMGRGVPFISTIDTKFQRMKIAESGGGILSGNTPKALAKAIRKLLDDPKAALEMGERGYKYAREHFDIAVTKRNILALYDDLDSSEA